MAKAKQPPGPPMTLGNMREPRVCSGSFMPPASIDALIKSKHIFRQGLERPIGHGPSSVRNRWRGHRSNRLVREEQMPSAQEIDIGSKRLQKLFRAVGDLDTQNLTRDDPYIDQLQAAYDEALRFAFGDASDRYKQYHRSLKLELPAVLIALMTDAEYRDEMAVRKGDVIGSIANAMDCLREDYARQVEYEKRAKTLDGPKDRTPEQDMTKERIPLEQLPGNTVQRATQAKIFISYRREGDAALAGRIADRLGNEFGSGHVFMDVDAMRLGFDFVEIINEEVAKCDVLLAVIGPRWLELLDTNQSNPMDFVRLEIAAALKRKIPVVPILVDGTKIPPADRLPEELQGLERRHALNLRHDSFRADVDRLVRELKR